MINMVKSKILCENCNKEYIIEVEYPSDLFDIKCPKCKVSDKVWILDSGFTSNDKGITLGVHSGCSQK